METLTLVLSFIKKDWMTSGVVKDVCIQIPIQKLSRKLTISQDLQPLGFNGCASMSRFFFFFFFFIENILS